MQRLAQQILEYAATRPEGSSLRAKELLHLGSRAAVDQALSRLHRRGTLMRIGRGLYVRPIEGRFGARPPSPAKVVETLSVATGETITPNGATAANALGLTTQVPIRPVYLTSGRSRRIRLGAQVLELRHAPQWQLVLAGEPGGDAVRALSWLGEKQAKGAIRALEGRLPASELRAMTDVRGRLPTWMARAVSALVVHA
jgi:hypothetical protein